MNKENGQEAGLMAAVGKQLCPDLDAKTFANTVREMCCKNVKGGVSREEFAAFLMTCQRYELNPIMGEIHIMRTKAGVKPVVGIDGWMTIANRHPQFDGIEVEERVDEKTGKPICCIATVHRKDRTRPTQIPEWYRECYRDTEPWNSRPIRMLRHKACIQAIRYAFNLSGIMDPEEASEIMDVRQAERERDRLTIGPMKLEVEAAKSGVTVQELEEVSQEVYSKTYSLLDNAEAEIVLKTAIDSRQILDAMEDQGDTGDIRQPAPPDNQATSAGVAASEQEEFPL